MKSILQWFRAWFADCLVRLPGEEGSTPDSLGEHYMRQDAEAAQREGER